VVNRAGFQPERDRELPFRAGRSYAAGLCGRTLAVKGGPEMVLAACVEGQDDDLREALLAHVHDMATRGLRVIAVADRALTDADLAIAREKGLEPLCGSGLRLLGFLGITDTPRADARELLLGLAKREIGVRVITGDHPATARAIAREIGLEVADDQIITGARWERLSIAERAEVVEENVIYARMSPEQKVQIVQQISQLYHVEEQARHLAAESVAAASNDPERLEFLYAKAFSRSPTEEERAMALQFLADAQAANDEKLSPWDRLTQVLLITNEFMFVD
jgi:H+-transporting ATPase